MKTLGIIVGGMAYAAGLAVAALSLMLTVMIGPIDAFAVGMIAVPSAVAVAGAIVLVRAGGARPGAVVAVLAVVATGVIASAVFVGWLAATLTGPGGH